MSKRVILSLLGDGQLLTETQLVNRSRRYIRKDRLPRMIQQLLEDREIEETTVKGPLGPAKAYKLT